MVLHAQGRRWPASVSVQQFAPECMVTQRHASRCNRQALKRKLQDSRSSNDLVAERSAVVTFRE
jgi:hypothetical protein